MLAAPILLVKMEKKIAVENIIVPIKEKQVCVSKYYDAHMEKRRESWTKQQSEYSDTNV